MWVGAPREGWNNYVLNLLPCVRSQVELYDAETMKKEALPDLRICNFLQSEVWRVDQWRVDQSEVSCVHQTSVIQCTSVASVYIRVCVVIFCCHGDQMLNRGEVWITLCCGWTVTRKEKTSAVR